MAESEKGKQTADLQKLIVRVGVGTGIPVVRYHYHSPDQC